MIAYTIRTDPQKMFLDMSSRALITSERSCERSFEATENQARTDGESGKNHNDPSRGYGTVTEQISRNVTQSSRDEGHYDRDGNSKEAVNLRIDTVKR